ncbi:hypothetical protein JOQ06_024265 [Pogonophryne albipinna]|uniref:Endonuclease/exonuclease/phosphatase domain-containing protein n=1 Tax=Pogonophryne albipinna TaxID=1090488 RepID=A0AAD6BMT7_9TELE|nr:hypothetical protein JOQ06_024265 [Pogonophryne albipinna]
MRPHYLPREFTHVIVIAAYIPPSANAEEACDVISSTVRRLQTPHPNALLLISGDFNHASLSKTLPTFKQYVTCTTRGNKTLDLLYANTKDAYSSSPLPPLGNSDHNLVHLQPVDQPCTVKKWSEESEEALKDCFDTTAWDVFTDSHGEDINGLTDCITSKVHKEMALPFCCARALSSSFGMDFRSNLQHDFLPARSGG